MRQSSPERTVDMLVRLMQGNVLTYDDWCSRYHKEAARRTFQRDLAVIKNTLLEYDFPATLERDGELITLNKNSSTESFSAVIACAHILLASRGLPKNEMMAMLAMLENQLSPRHRELGHDYLQMAKASYVPLPNAKALLPRLLELAPLILRHQEIAFSYTGSDGGPQTIQHGRPESLFFDNYYFYVAIQSREHHGYWTYRVDRILAIDDIASAAMLDPARRFSLQDYRKNTYLQRKGELTTLQFKCWIYPQTELYRFPESKIIRPCERGGVVIEARAYSAGALMWLLSEGAQVQPISPPTLVAQLKDQLRQAVAQYDRD